jgi:hypothetical protein
MFLDLISHPDWPSTQSYAPEADMQGSNSHTKWRVSTGVRATINEDGAVLLDIDKGLCYSLNAVGGRVWQVFEAGHGKSSIDDIVGALAREFTEVPREQLALDIESCVRDLESNGLITTDDRDSLAKAHKTKS